MKTIEGLEEEARRMGNFAKIVGKEYLRSEVGREMIQEVPGEYDVWSEEGGTGRDRELASARARILDYENEIRGLGAGSEDVKFYESKISELEREVLGLRDQLKWKVEGIYDVKSSGGGAREIDDGLVPIDEKSSQQLAYGEVDRLKKKIAELESTTGSLVKGISSKDKRIAKLEQQITSLGPEEPMDIPGEHIPTQESHSSQPQNQFITTKGGVLTDTQVDEMQSDLENLKNEIFSLQGQLSLQDANTKAILDQIGSLSPWQLGKFQKTKAKTIESQHFFNVQIFLVKI